MTVCIWPSRDAPLVCKYLSETYDDISKSVPINQKKVEEYASPNR